MLTGSRGFFWERYKLKTQFTQRRRPQAGSPVLVAGVEVGTVTDVELTGEDVDVTFEVKKDMRDRITTASIATLGSVSLLGEGAVEITPSTQRDADSGVGLRAGRQAAAAVLGHHQPGQRGRRGDQRAGRGHPRRARHGRQADDRRSAVRRNAAVRGDRRRDDTRHPAGPRHARQADQRPEGREDASRPRSRTSRR